MVVRGLDGGRDVTKSTAVATRYVPADALCRPLEACLQARFMLASFVLLFYG